MDVQKRDSGQYFFRIQRGLIVKYNYLNCMVNVSVKALTQKPDIYILGTLEAGQLLKVICVVPPVFVCGTSPLFSWTGAILSFQEFIRETFYFSELTLSPRPQDHGSNLSSDPSWDQSKHRENCSSQYYLINTGILDCPFLTWFPKHLQRFTMPPLTSQELVLETTWRARIQRTKMPKTSTQRLFQ